MKNLTFAAFAALMPMAALAHDGLAVNEPYARSSNPQSGAVFMTLENHTDHDCTLLGANSEAAERVELHTHREEDGVMKMMHVPEGFTIPAKGSHVLERGGDHVMLMGLHQPLLDGEVVSVTLDFGPCGTLDAEAVVDNARQPEAAGTDQPQGHAGH